MTAILGMGHSTPGLGANQPGLRHDPEWFRTAVFYEVLVRAFGDSTGSGEGDFAGAGAGPRRGGRRFDGPEKPE